MSNPRLKRYAALLKAEHIEASAKAEYEYGSSLPFQWEEAPIETREMYLAEAARYYDVIAPRLSAERDALAARIAAVIDIHRKTLAKPGSVTAPDWCAADEQDWPCPTIRALRAWPGG